MYVYIYIYMYIYSFVLYIIHHIEAYRDMSFSGVFSEKMRSNDVAVFCGRPQRGMYRLVMKV